MSGAMDVRGTLAVLGNVLSWAIVPVLLRDLTHAVDAWTANGIRYPLAAVFYWPILASGLRSGTLTRRVLVLALVPAALAFGGQVLWALAPYYLEASSIAFLIKMSVAWGILAAMLLFPGERALLRSKSFYLGLALAVAGFLGMTLNGEALSGDVEYEGFFVLLGCSVFFGLYAVSVRYFMQQVRPLIAFGVVSQYVSMGTVVLMFWLGEMAVIPGLTARAWWVLAASSFLGIGLSHVLYYIAIQRLGAALPTAMHFVAPFVTALLANAFLGETLTASQWIAGLGLVSGGVFLLVSQTSIHSKGLKA